MVTAEHLAKHEPWVGYTGRTPTTPVLLQCLSPWPPPGDPSALTLEEPRVSFRK